MLQRWFRQRPLVRSVIRWSKQHSLAGFFGVPIYDVFVFVINEFKRFDLFTRANSIAFSFFLSLFPTLLALFTFVPFLLDILAIYIPAFNNFNLIIYEEIKRIMPGQAGDIVYDFVEQIVEQPRVGLLSFGFLLAIYFSSNGMLAMMQSFEKSYHYTFRQRTALKKRLVSVALTALLGVLLLASIIFVILGNIIIDWLARASNLSVISTAGVDLLRWVGIILVYYLGIAMLYRYGAATYRRFAIVTPGTTLATILSILVSVAFSFYVDGFNRYDSYSKFYGSIGTVIIVMLWIQMNSLILLIGFELNASIAVNRDLKAQIEEQD